MIRVLKNADFSDCNLGTVTLPVEDTQEALFVVGKFSNLSSEKTNKVKTLINGLVNAGIYSKLHYLMLPYVAGSVEEALQNVLIDTQVLPNIESLETEENQDNVSLDSDGLTFTSGGRINISSLIIGVLSGSEFSMGGCLKYPSDWSSNETVITRGILYTDRNNQTPRLYYNKFRQFAVNGAGFSSVTYNEQHSQSDTNVQVVSISKTAGEYACLNGFNTVRTVSINTGSYNDADVNKLEINASGSKTSQYHATQTGHYRLLFIGDVLTSSEITTFRDLIAAFCDHVM